MNSIFIIFIIRNFGLYLEKMFTFQMFPIVFMITFLSDVLVKDSPVVLRLTDLTLKYDAMLVCSVLTAQLLSFI